MQSKKINNFLEEYLTCPICLEIMNNPSTLRCGHNYCLDCIKRNKVECPVCRTQIENELKVNFQLKNIIEAMRIENEKERMKKIQNFNRENEIKTPPNMNRVNKQMYSGKSNFSSGETQNKYRVKRLHSEMSSFDNNNFNTLSFNQKLNNVNFNSHNFYSTPVDVKPKTQSKNIDAILDNILNQFTSANPQEYFSNTNTGNNFNSSGNNTIDYWNPHNFQNNYNNININFYNYAPPNNVDQFSANNFYKPNKILKKN